MILSVLIDWRSWNLLMTPIKDIYENSWLCCHSNQWRKWLGCSKLNIIHTRVHQHALSRYTLAARLKVVQLYMIRKRSSQNTLNKMTNSLLSILSLKVCCVDVVTRHLSIEFKQSWDLLVLQGCWIFCHFGLYCPDRYVRLVDCMVQVYHAWSHVP